MCFSENTIKIGVSANLGHCFLAFLGQKSRVSKWSTLGSISGPHFASNFVGRCGPLIDPRSLFKVFDIFKLDFFKNLILAADRRR